MWTTTVYAADGSVIKEYMHEKEPSMMNNGVIILDLGDGRRVYLVGTIVSERRRD